MTSLQADMHAKEEIHSWKSMQTELPKKFEN